MLRSKRTNAECNDNDSVKLQPKKMKPFVQNEEEYDDNIASAEIVKDNITLHVSTVFSSSTVIVEKFLEIESNLSNQLQNIKFLKPVEYVYNPLEYAFEVHAAYVKTYCNSAKKVLFLGMNPGPWGMSQTGVPFGEIATVRDWLKLSGVIRKPAKEQPDRKITGFACTRSEISGQRFWNLFRELCHIPENFFRYAFMHNYCPLALMDNKGRNITPAELKGEAQIILQNACDKALISTLKLLEITILVGVGKFAEKRAQAVVKAANLPIKVVNIPHPSPRAVGNEKWNDKAKNKLQELGLLQYFTK